jgi:hypothetical protein
MCDTILVIHENLECYTNFTRAINDSMVSPDKTVDWNPNQWLGWNQRFAVALARYGGRFVYAKDNSGNFSGEFWLQFGTVEDLVEFKLRWV